MHVGMYTKVIRAIDCDGSKQYIKVTCTYAPTIHHF